MIYRILFFLCALCIPTFVLGQAKDSLAPLWGNEVLMHTHQFISAPIQALSKREDDEPQNNYVFEYDTIALPFIDDFSRNRVKKFTFDRNDPGIRIDSFFIFKVNGIYQPVYEGMLDTSYAYFYNSISNFWDSTPNTFDVIQFLNDTFQTVIAEDTLWPKPNGRIENGIFVSVNIEADTILVNRADTIFYIPSNNDGALWLSNDVYINNTYGMFEPTYGVATFDGLDSTGQPHIRAFTPNLKGEADVFVSAPIMLGTKPFGGFYDITDSLLFSFYYQPQGMGERPEVNDSLTLEFYAPFDDEWVWQWGAKGEATKPFEQVKIPIRENRFMVDGFQFRFKNFATLTGNFDHWNIDYVHLDANRSMSEDGYDDVAYIGQGQSIIKNYSQMPWSHFKSNAQQFMRDTVGALVYNNHSLSKNVSFGTDILDGTNVLLSTPLNQNVEPLFQAKSSLEKYINTSPFVLPDTSTATRKAFWVKSILNTTPDFNRLNDTLFHYQQFGTFYAYDDGSAEAAYFVEGPGSSIAVKFNCELEDTLRAVNIFFPRTYEDYSQQFFSIKIWSSLFPEVLLYESPYFNPIYSEGRDLVQRFDIEPMLIEGEFFVGIEQLNLRVYVGFDKNYNSQSNVFYQVGGGWQNASFPGSVFIRPDFGTENSPWPVSIGENTKSNAFTPKVYPNPSSSVLNIRNETSLDELNARLYNLHGSLVLIEKAQHVSSLQLDVSGLATGIYLLQLESDKGTVTQKVSIVR